VTAAQLHLFFKNYIASTIKTGTFLAICHNIIYLVVKLVIHF